VRPSYLKRRELIAYIFYFLPLRCLWRPQIPFSQPTHSRAWNLRTLWRLRPRLHAHSSADADCGSQGSQVIRYVREHSLPRVLPSSRFPEGRIPRLMAHPRILRASGCALPSFERNATEATVLGARDTGAMADRLATHESGFVRFRYFETRKYRTGQKQSFDN
jgi:hypothetical protein